VYGLVYEVSSALGLQYVPVSDSL